MFTKLTLSAILVAVLATTASAASAAPRHNGTVQPTGAERWQDRGLTEASGFAYEGWGSGRQVAYQQVQQGLRDYALARHPRTGRRRA